MKNKIIISIILLSWLCGLLGVYFVTKTCINKKDRGLFKQALESVENYFAGREWLMCVDYSDKKVEFERIPIPQKPKEDSNNAPLDNRSYGERLESWESDYKDISKLYNLKPRYESDDKWTGWQFRGLQLVVHTDHEAIISQFIVYPYKVGIKRLDPYYGCYILSPTVQEAVDGAFEFYTNPEKSPFRDYLSNKSEVDIYALRNVVDNDYYELWSYDIEPNKEWFDSVRFNTKWSRYPVDIELTPNVYTDAYNAYSLNYSGMYNGYYSVFNEYQTGATWEIKYKWRSNPKQRDLLKFQIIGGAILTILMLCLIIPLIIIKKKEEVIANEGLQERLKRLSNPSNFMKQYDKEKVEIANKIYQQLLANDISDNELVELQKKAVSELGINLIEENQLKRLKEKVNPEHYMKPYDAEKVSLANELFARISKTSLTYEEYKVIEEESKKLS